MDTDELKRKILQGLDLALERLIQAKALADEELVLYRAGRIEYVKARDLLQERVLTLR